jgi:hypothetical protein
VRGRVNLLYQVTCETIEVSPERPPEEIPMKKFLIAVTDEDGTVLDTFEVVVEASDIDLNAPEVQQARAALVILGKDVAAGIQ